MITNLSNKYDKFEIDDLYSEVRTLLSAQKNLRTLRIQVDEDENFFDQKLVLQSKLKNLSLYEELMFYNFEEAEDFLEFLESQDQLKSFEHQDIVFPECNERLKNFKQKRLNLIKVKDIEISFWDEEHSSRHLASVNKTMLMGPPNLDVENIRMHFNGGESGYIESYFPLMINSKFPNVENIAICSNLQIDFNALKDFKKLIELCIVNVGLESLKSITIPNLKFFTCHLEKSLTADQLKEFFMRHKAIKTLEIDIADLSSTYSDEEKLKKLIDVVGDALKNLKHLKSIDVLEESKVKGQYKDSVINKIITSITKHAQPGFLFNLSLPKDWKFSSEMT